MLRPAPTSATLRALGMVVGATLIMSAWQAPAGTVGEPWIDTSNRDAVVVAFAAEYANGTPAMDWDGAYEGCDPGSSSEALRRATVRRVNFYRAMAGVPTGVVEDEEYSLKAQHAALAMSAEGRLSHSPGDDFACLTDDGKEAAANSNLYLGRTGPAAVDGYIEDPGIGNRDVGHRNTILHPTTRRMGVGHVAGGDQTYPANALWVFDDRVFDPSPPLREPDGFVAWPPRGYVPAPLVYPRWSLSRIGADFEKATVTVTTDGRAVSLEVVARHSLQGHVPAPIIVWEPVLGPVTAEDVEYRVVVDGVLVDGRTRRFEYDVTVMAERPAPSILAAGGPLAELAFQAVRAALDEVAELVRS